MDAVILSSSDILRILSGDAIVRQEGRLAIVEGGPGFGVDEAVYIYVEKYPTIEEFEATWRIWVRDNSGMGKYVLDAMTALLPNFDFQGDHYTTTDFATSETVIKTQEEIEREESKKERAQFKEQFSGLKEGLEARIGAVSDGRDGVDGRDGLDGRDGRDGKDGRDGRDLDATEVQLFDLKDVEQSSIALKKGQVLMWDGSSWTNLYVPQIQTLFTASGGGSGDGEGVIISDTAPTEREDGTPLQEGDQWWSSQSGVMYVWYVDSDGGQWVQSSGGGGGGGIEEAPIDGQEYVRKDAQWVVASNSGGGGGGGNGGGGSSECTGIIDGGDVETGNAIASGDGSVVDGGDVDTGTAIPPVCGGGGDVEEAPDDGNYYVRHNNSWVNLLTALEALNVTSINLDGGNFTSGLSEGTERVIGGGNFTTGEDSGNGLTVDGGDVS